jgi:hypothetical protein
MGDSEKNDENKKVQPRLSPLMHKYLDDLVATRLYGGNPTDVARTLIEHGVKQAIADRHINVRKERKPRSAP